MVSEEMCCKPVCSDFFLFLLGYSPSTQHTNKHIHIYPQQSTTHILLLKAYLRFCAVDYSLDNLADKYQHLANNSIAKKSKAFKESPIPGNMWHTSQFDFLKETTGEDKWPGMERMQKMSRGR